MFSTFLSAKSLQSCPTLCDPIDGSPPGSPISGILQARTLEWVAISFSNAWKWKVKGKSLSRVWLFATPWTVAYQAPPSMGFSRPEYWSGVPSPSPQYSINIKWNLFNVSKEYQDNCIRLLCLSKKHEVVTYQNVKRYSLDNWLHDFFFFLQFLVLSIYIFAKS